MGAKWFSPAGEGRGQGGELDVRVHEALQGAEGENPGQDRGADGAGIGPQDEPVPFRVEFVRRDRGYYAAQAHEVVVVFAADNPPGSRVHGIGHLTSAEDFQLICIELAMAADADDITAGPAAPQVFRAVDPHASLLRPEDEH